MILACLTCVDELQSIMRAAGKVPVAGNAAAAAIVAPTPAAIASTANNTSVSAVGGAPAAAAAAGAGAKATDQLCEICHQMPRKARVSDDNAVVCLRFCQSLEVVFVSGDDQR